MEIELKEGYTEVAMEISQEAKLSEDPENPELNPELNPENDDNDHPNTAKSLCFIYRFIRATRRFLFKTWRRIKMTTMLFLLLVYLAYFSYCMYYKFGNEQSIRLLVVTVFGLLVVLNFIFKRFVGQRCRLFSGQCLSNRSKMILKLRKVVRWLLYLSAVGGGLTIVVVDVFPKRPANLICLLGLAILILVCVFFSRQPEQINWHTVFWGMGLQFWFAVLIQKTRFGSYLFQWLADRFVEFLKHSDKGSQVVFGAAHLQHRFIFQIMPTIIFFNATISALYYLGLVQVFIAKFGKFLNSCLDASPVETVNTAANLFLTVAEAPLVIKPFLPLITQSELFAVLTGGFASVAGSLLWALAANGAPMDHILTASVMSAPAALAFAKLMYPDERKPTVKAKDAYNVDVGHYGSLLGALSDSAKEGLTMVGLIVVNLMVYIDILAFLDQTLLWFAARAGVQCLTFSKLVAYVLYPVTFLMGFEPADCLRAAYLLGVKTLTSTVMGFLELGTIITNGKTLATYIDTYNGTWTYVGDDIFLEAINTTLVGGVLLSERSGVLATYMLCGISNLGSISVAIGSLAALAPSRSKDVIRMVPLALLAGNFASFSTACIAGLLYTD